MERKSVRRAARIREKVPVAEVLVSLGYEIRKGDHHEQQFRCDLHGTGRDNKPSARVYPDTNSWYCWGCGRARDPISTLRAKFGWGFHEACLHLERTYGLPPLEGQDDEPDSEFHLEFDHTLTLDEEVERTRKFITSLAGDRDLTLHEAVRAWCDFDEIVGLQGAGLVEESAARRLFAAIRTRLAESLKRRSECLSSP